MQVYVDVVRPRPPSGVEIHLLDRHSVSVSLERFQGVARAGDLAELGGHVDILIMREVSILCDTHILHQMLLIVAVLDAGAR